MGKLMDLLEQATRGVVQPLGFTASRKEKASPLLLIGRVRLGDGAAARKAVAAGCHALVWAVEEDGQTSPAKASSKGLDGIVCGVWRRGLDDAPAKEMDFEVFSSDQTPIGSLLDEARNVFMQVEPEMDDGMLRVLEDLPVSAFLVSLADAPSLTLRQLVRVARIRGAISKHLLLHLAVLPSKEELGVLRDAGVSALVVDVAAHKAEELQACRARLDELPQSAPQRRGESRVATLPHLRVSSPSAPQREGEEYEEEED